MIDITCDACAKKFQENAAPADISSGFTEDLGSVKVRLLDTDTTLSVNLRVSCLRQPASGHSFARVDLCRSCLKEAAALALKKME